MATFKSSKRFSLGFQNQTDFTTFPVIGTSASWAWLDLIEPPTISFARQIEARPDAPTGQAGAGRAPITGSRHGGTITFRLSATSMTSGYDASAAVPVYNVDPITSTNPLFNLIKTFMTGHTIGTSSTNTDLSTTGNDANTLEVDAGPSYDFDSGTGYLHDKDGAGDLQWFFTNSGTTTGTTVELLEDYVGIVADMDSAEIIPSITFYPENAPAPTFHSFLYEDDLTLANILYGAFHQSTTLSINPGETPTWEFTFGFTAHKKITSSIGFIVPTVYNAVPPTMDINNGRANIGGPQDADGTFTVAADTQCINALSITWTSSSDMVKCHGHAGGSFQDVSDVVTTDLDVKVTMTVAHENGLDDGTALDTDWDVLLDNQTSRGITVYAGNTEGYCMAVVIPAAHLVEQPQWEIVGEALIGYTLTWEPGTYVSGTAADDAAQAGSTPIRIALA